MCVCVCVFNNKKTPPSSEPNVQTGSEGVGAPGAAGLGAAPRQRELGGAAA